MNNTILNDMALSEELKESFFNLDDSVIEACDRKAKDICLELFPGIDFTRQENIDLVIRPMSAVIAINEIVLQNMFSESSIDGIMNSKTLSSSMKSVMLKNFANLNGIKTASNDPDSLYSEIAFNLHNNNLNRKHVFDNSIVENFPDIDRLFFADTKEPEMVRNKIPYLQIDHLKVMTFSRSEFNRGTVVGLGYNRDDYERYQHYKESDRVEIPGVLDVYFSTPIESTSVQIFKGEKYYFFDPAYYISIESASGKDFVIVEEDMFTYGIVKTGLRIFMPEGDASETFIVRKYKDPMFENYYDSDEFSITDVMNKGFFPMFVNLDIFTRYSIDETLLREKIEDYLQSKSGNMADISINGLQNFLRTNGLVVTIAARANADLFISAGISVPMDVVFPLSVKDLSLPPEVESAQFTERTIKIFAGEINVEKE